MGRQNESSRLISIIGPQAIALISAYLLLLLPREVQNALMVWTLVSVPVGMLFGHCVLSEDPRPISARSNDEAP